MTLPATDNEGYLLDANAWDENIACMMAAKEHMTLTPEHMEVILLLRDFHSEYGHSPNNRVFVRHLQQRRPEHGFDSARLMQLFGGMPAKTAARIAGLPRPTHCL